MPRKSKRLTLALHTAELAAASAQTILRRTQRMAAAGLAPRAADRREMTRMVQEKVEAALESTRAAGAQWLELQWGAAAAWARLWRPVVGVGTPSRRARGLLQEATRLQERLSGASSEVMKSYRHRASRNARRLARAKR